MSDEAVKEEAAKQARGVRKSRKGTVVSKSGDKTIVVQVERRYSNPIYGQVLSDLRKVHAQDEQNKARVGDKVRIVECRPLSRMKRWRLVEIEKAATAAE